MSLDASELCKMHPHEVKRKWGIGNYRPKYVIVSIDATNTPVSLLEKAINILAAEFWRCVNIAYGKDPVEGQEIPHWFALMERRG